MSKNLSFLFLALAGTTCLLSGCAGGPDQTTQAAATGQDQVSTIPWNRPEKWEGPGILGGQMNPQSNY